MKCGQGVRATNTKGQSFPFSPEIVFERCPIPPHLASAAGGLAVGAIGLLFPQVFGLGYPTGGSALADQLPLMLMASLLVAKLVATWLTVGSGASGGVIGPSLCLGALPGGCGDHLFPALFPGATSTSGNFALAGMAAVFAAAFHAPITAVALGVELTGAHSLTVPLILASATSGYVARRLSPYTIYLQDIDAWQPRWRHTAAGLTHPSSPVLLRPASRAN